MTRNRDWSRRGLLKSAATGAAVLGMGAAVVDSVDRYIVGALERDAVSAATAVSDARHEVIELGDEGTLVSGVYSRGLSQRLLARSDVAFVEPDRTLQHPTMPADARPADAGQTMPWGIDRVDADVAHEHGDTGEDVHVAVVDGGIDPDHPDLEANLADPGVDGNHRAWTDCSGDCEYDWADDGDHGTHVAGTVAAVDDGGGVVGVAPEATLHALKVCGSAGRCQTSDIVEAIKFAADQDWGGDGTVVNLSLGSPHPSDAIQAAGEYAAEKGVVLVAAAGNSGPCSDCVGYPAVYPEFVAVSATTREDDVAEFSSRGEEVDIGAPGKDVCSGVVGGDHDVFSGTSMASPHVAGAAAQLLARGHSATEARKRLADTAEDIGAGENAQGAGLLDVAAALEHDSGDDGTGDGIACPA